MAEIIVFSLIQDGNSTYVKCGHFLNAISIITWRLLVIEMDNLLSTHVRGSMAYAL